LTGAVLVLTLFVFLVLLFEIKPMFVIFFIVIVDF
jgi:hypothetical protein